MICDLFYGSDILGGWRICLFWQPGILCGCGLDQACVALIFRDIGFISSVCLCSRQRCCNYDEGFPFCCKNCIFVRVVF